MISDNFEEKVLNGEKLNEDELQYLINEYEVETEFGENSRWSRGATTISEVQGRFFMTSWENGLTEYQDNEYYDQPTEVKGESPKFKRGDILYCEYFDFDANGWIEIIKDFTEHDEKTNYYAALTVKDSCGETLRLKFNDYHNAVLDVCRLATPSEQKLLFNALVKEGKKWNPDTLQIEDVVSDKSKLKQAILEMQSTIDSMNDDIQEQRARLSTIKSYLQ